MRTVAKGIYLITLLSLVLSACSSQRTIVNGLDEREANEILVFLANKNVPADKVLSSEGGGVGAAKITLWDIQVNEANATQAMALLNIAGLPRRRGKTLLGIFSGGGLVPSQMEEKIRFQAGLAEQIATTIRKIDGVLDSDVQLSFPEEDPLNPEKVTEKVSASVYVKHSGILDDPNAHLQTKIRRLVASSIPGLQFDNVTVIGDRARYADILLPSQVAGKQEKQFKRVWTVLVAQESVARFQTLFFTFFILILLLFLALMWLIWKLYPVIKESGGVKQLAKIRPIQPHDLVKEEPKEPKEEKGEEKEEKEEEEEEAEGEPEIEEEGEAEAEEEKEEGGGEAT